MQPNPSAPPQTARRNEAAEGLHGRINVSAEYPYGRKELHALADAALAEERRLVVAEIREIAQRLNVSFPVALVLDESDRMTP